MHLGVDIVSRFIECLLFVCNFQGKRLAPEYEKAATTLAQNDPPVTLVKVIKNIQ